MWMFRELWESLRGRSRLCLNKSFSFNKTGEKSTWDDMRIYSQYTPEEDTRQRDECEPSKAT